jgi:hypothetical protein
MARLRTRAMLCSLGRNTRDHHNGATLPKHACRVRRMNAEVPTGGDMSSKTVTAGRLAVGAAVLLAVVLTAQVAAASAAGVEAGVYAMPQVVAQVPTPTPFRFLTPTPITPRTTTSSTTTTVTATTAPRTGAFPLELALPALAGGLTAIGGGTYLLRRKPAR